MPYTTVDKVKKYSQVQYTDLGFADDPNFESWITNTLIPAAEGYVDAYCGRDFNQNTVTETYDGNDKNYLFLKHYPVLSVSSVKVSGTAINNSDYIWKSSGLIKLKGDAKFPKGVGNIEVTYTYGYSSVPTAIDDVTARIAARILQIMVQNKMGILVRVDEFKVQIADYRVITEDIKVVLERYRKVI